MKLLELINSVDFDEVFQHLKEMWEESDYDSYRRAVDELLVTTPSESADMSIYVHQDDEEIIVDCIDDKGEIWAMDFIPWHKLLAMDIVIDFDPVYIVSYQELLGHILWKLTYHGYSSSTVETEGQYVDELAKQAFENITGKD